MNSYAIHKSFIQNTGKESPTPATTATDSSCSHLAPAVGSVQGSIWQNGACSW